MSTPQTQMQCITEFLASLCLILPGNEDILVTISSLILESRAHLKDGKILQDTVHHVFFRQSLKFVYKVDHVITHRRSMNAVHKATVLQARIFRFDLLDNLLAERADFCRARDDHAFVALETE